MALSEKGFQTNFPETESLNITSGQRLCNDALDVLNGAPALNTQSLYESARVAPVSGRINQLSSQTNAEASGTAQPNQGGGNPEQKLSLPCSSRQINTEAEKSIENRDLDVGAIGGVRNPEFPDNKGVSGTEGPAKKRNSNEDNTSVNEFRSLHQDLGTESPNDSNRYENAKVLNTGKEDCAARGKENQGNLIFTARNDMSSAVSDGSKTSSYGDRYPDGTPYQTGITNLNLESKTQSVGKTDQHLTKEIPQFETKHDGRHNSTVNDGGDDLNRFGDSLTFTKKRSDLKPNIRLASLSDQWNRNSSPGRLTGNHGNATNHRVANNGRHGGYVKSAETTCTGCQRRMVPDQFNWREEIRNSPYSQDVPQISDQMNERVVDLPKKSLKYLNMQLGTKPFDRNWTCIADLHQWKNTRMKSFENIYRGECFVQMLYEEEFVDYKINEFLNDLKSINRHDILNDFRKKKW